MTLRPLMPALILFAAPAMAAEGVTPSTTQSLAPRSLGTIAIPVQTHAVRTVETAPAWAPRYQTNYTSPAQPRQTAYQQPAAQQTYDIGSVSAQKPLDYLIFSGVEASGHNGEYGNLGAIGAIGNSHFGDGPVWRVMTDALGYSYVGGPANSKIDGTAYAGEAALGYIKSFQGGSSVAGYIGGVYRHTSLSPNDPGNDLRGGQWGLKTQAEGTLYYTPDLRSGLQAAYVAGPDSWWARGNTQYRPFGNFFIGPEAVVQGDSTYTAWQLGGLLNGIKIGDTSEMGVRAGYKKIENLTGTIYGGAEFSTMF